MKCSLLLLVAFANCVICEVDGATRFVAIELKKDVNHYGTKLAVGGKDYKLVVSPQQAESVLVSDQLVSATTDKVTANGYYQIKRLTPISRLPITPQDPKCGCPVAGVSASAGTGAGAGNGGFPRFDGIGSIIRSLISGATSKNVDTFDEVLDAQLCPCRNRALVAPPNNLSVWRGRQLNATVPVAPVTPGKAIFDELEDETEAFNELEVDVQQFTKDFEEALLELIIEAEEAAHGEEKSALLGFPGDFASIRNAIVNPQTVRNIFLGLSQPQTVSRLPQGIIRGLDENGLSQALRHFFASQPNKVQSRQSQAPQNRQNQDRNLLVEYDFEESEVNDGDVIGEFHARINTDGQVHEIRLPIKQSNIKAQAPIKGHFPNHPMLARLIHNLPELIEEQPESVATVELPELPEWPRSRLGRLNHLLLRRELCPAGEVFDFAARRCVGAPTTAPTKRTISFDDDDSTADFAKVCPCRLRGGNRATVQRPAVGDLLVQGAPLGPVNATTVEKVVHGNLLPETKISGVMVHEPIRLGGIPTFGNFIAATELKEGLLQLGNSHGVLGLGAPNASGLASIITNLFRFRGLPQVATVIFSHAFQGVILGDYEAWGRTIGFKQGSLQQKSRHLSHATIKAPQYVKKSHWNIKVSDIYVGHDEPSSEHEVEAILDFNSAFNLVNGETLEAIAKAAGLNQEDQEELHGSIVYRLHSDVKLPTVVIELESGSLVLSGEHLITRIGHDAYLSFASAGNSKAVVLGEPFFKAFRTSFDYSKGIFSFVPQN